MFPVFQWISGSTRTMCSDDTPQIVPLRDGDPRSRFLTYISPVVPRLDHLLARNIGCTRGNARLLVTEGRVTDGTGAPLPDSRAIIDNARCPFEVMVDSDRWQLHDAFHLVLNKPIGVVTALRDDRHPTALTLLHNAPLMDDLRPVGRLDLDSTGLLIWTTDGDWLHRLTHPKHGIPRTYQAVLARPWSPVPPNFTLDDGRQPEILDLRALDPGALHPNLASLADQPAGALCATITLKAGAYHEVRRIFAALGSHVLALCRVSFGRLILPTDLPLGAWRPVGPDDV